MPTTPLGIVTGGSSGIGAHLVRAFARAGYAVACSYLGDAVLAEALVAELQAGGAPDVLVNNTCIHTWAPLLELSEERWDAVLRTNLKGCFLNTQRAARRMVAAGKGGSIINIGSGCSKLAFPRLVDYTASKGGIEQFTKVAAVKLGPQGIRVNCVAPGAIATERTAREAGDYVRTWSKLTPLRRIGTPEDVATVVLFLASPAAAFVTGQTIGVDGGLFTRAIWPHSSYEESHS